MEDNENTMYPRPFPGQVADIIDEYTLVINRGKKDDVIIGQRFIVYKLTEREIIDPETGKKLGNYEHFTGSGKIVLVTDEWSTLESNMKIESQNQDLLLNWPGIGIRSSEWRKANKLTPFDFPKKGDYVKPA